jgi:N-hydroxyarylamine O-acetyltransferase
MLLGIELADGTMLADVGFGGLTLTAPLRLRGCEEQATPHETLRIVAAGEDHLVQACIEGIWRDVYRFDLSSHHAVDYAQQNWHTATRPGALFANNLVVTLPTAQGRHTLFNRSHVFRPLRGAKVVNELQDIAAMQSVLNQVYGIELTDTQARRAWQVSGISDAPSSIFS